MPDLAAIWGQYADSNLTFLFHEVGEIFIPVHIIASLVADATWIVKKKKDDSPVFDNEYMNGILSKPNPLQTWQELIYQKEAYELVTGKSYVYANAPDTYSDVNYRTLSTLVNLPADSVQIETFPVIKLLSATEISDLIKWFIVPSGSEGLTRIDPKKVMYTKFSSLKGCDMNIIGKSPMLSAQKAIGNIIAVYEARNVIFTSRGSLGLVVSKKGDADGMSALNPKEVKEMNEAFYDESGLTKGKKPIRVVAAPVDYIKINATISELQPFEETKADAAVIFGVYQVPREMMPGEEGATFENFNQALKTLYQTVVIKRANSLAQSLTNFLKLDEMGLYLCADFGHVQVLQQNQKEKSEADWKNNETYRVRFLHSVITLNDWRVAVGLEPVKNALYNKLLLEMDSEELGKVQEVIKLSAKGGNSNNNQNGDNGNTTQQ